MTPLAFVCLAIVVYAGVGYLWTYRWRDIKKWLDNE